MFDFVQGALVITSAVLTLAFVGLLVLLCIRTRSRGLIIITAVLILGATFDFISREVMTSFLDPWRPGEGWVAPTGIAVQFMMLYNYVTTILYNGLLALGAFLIYREWSRGKIRWNQQKSSEVVNHA